jgi:phasin family protein
MERTMLNTDQIAATNKANFDITMGLARKAFDGVEQITALNLQVVKSGLDDVAEAGLAAFSAKDGQGLLALQSGLLQPSGEKASAYGKQVYGIVSGFQAEVQKLVGEQSAAAQSAFLALIEAAGKNAPAGSINGIEFFKSALASANSTFDGLQKAGREAAETAEANFIALTGTSTAKAAGKTKRA